MKNVLSFASLLIAAPMLVFTLLTGVGYQHQLEDHQNRTLRYWMVDALALRITTDEASTLVKGGSVPVNYQGEYILIALEYGDHDSYTVVLGNSRDLLGSTKPGEEDFG